MLRDYFLNGAGELIPQVRVPSWGSPDWVRGSARWWDTRSSPVGWDIVGLWGRGPPPPTNNPGLALQTAPHPVLVN